MANASRKENLQITAFVGHWKKEFDFYEKLARKVQGICTEKLNEINVRHLPSSRAKPEDSIEDSIYRRQGLRMKQQNQLGQQQTEYGSYEEIGEDMIDLAGIRIKLYFPDDAEKVELMIKATFKPFKENWGKSTVKRSRIKKRHDDDQDIEQATQEKTKDIEDKELEDEWPLGYKSRHFRCKLKAANEDYQEYRKFKDCAFEIQVGSLMMYAWADVYHDIVYKPYFGKVTKEEERFLEIVNGLAHTGELALKQLQTSLQLRLATENRPFSSQYQLGGWLRQILDHKVEEFKGLELLCDILQALDFNTPGKLGPLIRGNEAALIECQMAHQASSGSIERAQLLAQHRINRSSYKYNLSSEVDLAVNLLYMILGESKPLLETTENQQLAISAVAHSTLCTMAQKYRTTAHLFDMRAFGTVDPIGIDLSATGLRTLDRWYGLKEETEAATLRQVALQLSYRGVAAWQPDLSSWRILNDDPWCEFPGLRKNELEKWEEIRQKEDLFITLNKGCGQILANFATGSGYWYKFRWDEVWSGEGENNIFDYSVLKIMAPTEVSRKDLEPDFKASQGNLYQFHSGPPGL